jgi:hypothetical protein
MELVLFIFSLFYNVKIMLNNSKVNANYTRLLLNICLFLPYRIEKKIFIEERKKTIVLALSGVLFNKKNN